MADQKSVPVLTRLTPELNQRVEAIVRERAYRSKSNFLEEAVRFYVEFCEGRNLPIASTDKVALFSN